MQNIGFQAAAPTGHSGVLFAGRGMLGTTGRMGVYCASTFIAVTKVPAALLGAGCCWSFVHVSHDDL